VTVLAQPVWYERCLRSKVFDMDERYPRAIANATRTVHPAMRRQAAHSDTPDFTYGYPSGFASTMAIAFWWSGEGNRWPSHSIVIWLDEWPAKVL
jgi:hypothetical protein